MTHEQAKALFEALYPDFFKPGRFESLPATKVYEEMILPLAAYAPVPELDAPRGVSFGFYEGDRAALIESVRTVDESWVTYFEKAGDVYCAMEGARPVSFCLISDMGTAVIDGKTLRVGGPGCVGTVPDCRRRGIGLKMIQNATAIVKERGYDLSYIHYTGVAPWYAKLGYQTILRWNKDGVID